MTRYEDLFDPLEIAADREPRKWYRRKRVVIPVVAFALFAFIGETYDEPGTECPAPAADHRPPPTGEDSTTITERDNA